MKPTEKEVIHQFIDLENDELIWFGHPPRMIVPSWGFFFGLSLSVAVIAAGFWKLYQILMADRLNPDYFVSKPFLFGTASWMLAIYGVIKLISYSNHLQSVIYGFTKKKAFWISKGIKFKVNELPFSDIQKIDLVGRMDEPETFTIHFSPAERLTFWGYNYEKNEPRPFPTFELLRHGDVVYKKLEEALWEFRKN